MRHTLSTALLSLPLEAGHTFAYLPAGIEPARANDLEEWHIATPESTARLVDFVSAYLRAREGRVGIFIDPNAAPTDPGLLDVADHFVTYRREVYFFVTGRDDEERIHDTLLSTLLYPAIGILTAPTPPLALADRQETAPEGLAALARGTAHVLVGAYDAETYIIWSHP
jgi:hypothetical protein